MNIIDMETNVLYFMATVKIYFLLQAQWKIIMDILEIVSAIPKWAYFGDSQIVRRSLQEVGIFFTVLTWVV